MLIASSVCAQKVYYWKDEKGVMNATTTPPPNNIKKYEVDNWGKQDSPEEIQRYQAEQKKTLPGIEAKDKANEQQEQINQVQEEAQKQKDRQPVQQQETSK
jgi:hypothetical protein